MEQPTTTDSFICSICQTEIPANFCTKCGQKKKSSKTSTASLVRDILSSTFSLEKSMFAHLIKIIRYPSRIVNNYMEGFRNYYPSPGRVLLYALTIAAIHLALIEQTLLGLSFDITIKDDVVAPQFLFWATFFPLIIVASYLSFIRNKYPFSKHLVSILYISGTFFILITIVSDLSQIIFNFSFETYSFLLFIILFVIWNSLALTTSEKVTWIALNSVIQAVIFLLIVFVFALLIYFLGGEQLELMH